MHAPASHLASLAERVKEEAPVVGIMKDVLAPVSACHDVVIGPGRLDSNAARHGSISIRERHLSSSCTLTPFSPCEALELAPKTLQADHLRFFNANHSRPSTVTINTMMMLHGVDDAGSSLGVVGVCFASGAFFGAVGRTRDGACALVAADGFAFGDDSPCACKR